MVNLVSSFVGCVFFGLIVFDSFSSLNSFEGFLFDDDDTLFKGLFLIGSYTIFFVGLLIVSSLFFFTLFASTYFCFVELPLFFLACRFFGVFLFVISPTGGVLGMRSSS